MATATILAAGCLSAVSSLWYPYFWTRHWGSNGFASCPQLCTCRFDCGWAADTFHEVHALTLERRNRPSKGAVRDLHDHTGLTSDHRLANLDDGQNGADLVTEQYQKAQGMVIVLPDGRVVNRMGEKELEKQRQTAMEVVVVDQLKRPNASRTTSRQTIGTTRPVASRVPTSTIPVEEESASRSEPKPSIETRIYASLSGHPLEHD